MQSTPSQLSASWANEQSTTPSSSNATPLPKSRFLILSHPKVIEKDKSFDPAQGVIRYPFWFGGCASCVSTTCTQPLGVATLRLQTQHHAGVRRDMTEMFVHIYKDEGYHGLWRGYTASLTRAVTYSGVRFGAYEALKEISTTTTHAPSSLTLAAIAAGSGFAGSVLGNFADVVCLRMQNDLSHPAKERYNYNNIFHGLFKMTRKEGWSSIWKGVWMNASRCAVSSATQLAGYDIAKRELLARTSLTDSVPTHVTASLISGFLATIICNPIDVVKARIMTAKRDHSIPVLIRHTVKNEGMSWIFRGLLPAFISRGPSTIVTFVTLEQLKRMYRRMNSLDD